MPKTKKSINHKCRTCFSASKDWNPLTAKTRDYKKRLKSYGELLQETTNINVRDNKSVKLPQSICGNCSRSLKTAHTFIHQAIEVNEKLYALLNEKLQCLQDLQQTGREIKEEQELVKENFKCLEETPIDLEPCIEIKVENERDDTRGEEKTDCLEETQIYEDVDTIMDRNFNQGEENSVNRSQRNKPERELKTSKTKKALNKDKVVNFDSESPQSEGSDWEEVNKTTNRKQSKTSKVQKNVQCNDDIAVPCSKCNKIFKNSKLLAVHQRISHIPEEKKCTCNLCGNKFTRYCNMYKHMRTFHGPETVKLISKRPEEDYIYKCDKCPKKYSRKKSLIYHTKLKHSSKVVENNESKTNNNTERKSSDKGSLCPICGSSFTSKNQLTVHLRRHTGERPFKCDLCERAFLLVTQLNSHKRLHTGEKPYKCQICEKTFRVSDDLRQHMRTHTNVRPHKCSQCERTFKHTQDLKIHLRSHTGERPYVCGVCGDSFQRYNTLRAHRLRMGHVENLIHSNANNKL